ncbi:MAG: hypothetical protein HYZ53_20115 [Planctomycetes bacterium]|nr:hypothetical protein [Planctomycetota bacterium]
MRVSIPRPMPAAGAIAGLVAVGLCGSTATAQVLTSRTESMGNSNLGCEIQDEARVEALSFTPSTAIRVTRTARIRIFGRERHALQANLRARKIPARPEFGVELSVKLGSSPELSLSGGYAKTFPVFGVSMPVWVGVIPVTLGCDVGATVSGSGGGTYTAGRFTATPSVSAGLGATAYAAAGIRIFRGFRVMAGIEGTASPLTGTLSGAIGASPTTGRLSGRLVAVAGGNARLALFAEAGIFRSVVPLAEWYFYPRTLWVVNF